ncbi:hypothetical protein RRG08_032120 [Elysia crispata]|uniref:Uncharacterized protein n=1 Tax=Elysia crispata TaxID=231223 RepID=A0AAE1DEZ4_9GAST|nr:hypothetical protein RRG08_032120 [Elysia crispata]
MSRSEGIPHRHLPIACLEVGIASARNNQLRFTSARGVPPSRVFRHRHRALAAAGPYIFSFSHFPYQISPTLNSQRGWGEGVGVGKTRRSARVWQTTAVLLSQAGIRCLGVCQRLASLPATSKQLGSVLLVSLPSSRLPLVNGFGVVAVVMATGPDSRNSTLPSAFDLARFEYPQDSMLKVTGPNGYFPYICIKMVALQSIEMKA